MPRYKLTIAYDGTEFCGWQKQEPPMPVEGAPVPADQSSPHTAAGPWERAERLSVREGESRERVALRTVQHVLEQAVAGVVREPVVVLGASRTDSGVHARGQVAAFTCSGEERAEADAGIETVRARTGWPVSRGMDRLVRALNGRLPEDVVVTGCEVAAEGFNPIRGAVDKAYSYLLHVSPGPPQGSGVRPLWDRRYVHHVWEPLDVRAMQEAAGRVVGEHDFAAFAAAGHGRLSTVRTVFTCGVHEVAGEAGATRLRIDITGSGFLWNMVRIIAGTLVDVGRGRKTPADVTAAIESRDRRNAGPTLPPTGLCLEWVKYA